MVGSNKVFVVDDEESVVESIRFILESEGYEVESFTDPRAMLDRGRKPVAGCLVTDVRMPGMSGLDMHERLQATGVSLPTIMVTGHGEVPDAVRAMKAGCVDFIQKPWSNAALLDRVRAAMQMDQDQRSLSAERGEVDDLSPIELAQELRTFLAATELRGTIFRSNHASNYLALKGTLPKDRDALVQVLDRVLADPSRAAFVPDSLRAL